MAWNFGNEVHFDGGECHRDRYITHFYCLAVEASFYGDMIECLPVDPATWVCFSAGAGKYFRSTTISVPCYKETILQRNYRKMAFMVIFL